VTGGTGATGATGATGIGTPISSATAAGPDTTNSSGYATITNGPSVTATIGASGRAMVIITGLVTPNQVSGTSCEAFMSFAVTAGSTVAASDNNAIVRSAGTSGTTGGVQASATTVLSGLTPGSNTFTTEYHKGGGSGSTCNGASFSRRTITVIPLG
jgi:hypothetical protein